MAEDEVTCLNIITGCYERTILGYELIEHTNQKRYELRQKFTDNAHYGYVKVIAANATFLASGSTDETIHLYNLATNTEVGSLMQHEGSITSLNFLGDNHLISSATDGLLCIWKTSNWDCQKVFRGHKEAIQSVSIHPSGKIALTVSKDKTLKTWDFVKGRPAYTTHIKEVADKVLWSPDGEIYLVVIGNVINIYDITTATVTDVVECKQMIHTVTFLKNKLIAVGGEGPDIFIYDLKKSTKEHVMKFQAHDKRTKDLCCSADHSSNPDKDVRWLTSVSSDGFIKVWQILLKKISCAPKLLASVNTTARLTCVTLQLTTKAEDVTNEETKSTKRKSEKEAKGKGSKKKRKSSP